MPITNSHGCVHITPKTRDQMIADGYLKRGTILEVRKYSDVAPLSVGNGGTEKYGCRIEYREYIALAVPRNDVAVGSNLSRRSAGKKDDIFWVGPRT